MCKTFDHMTSVRFERTPPKRAAPKAAALDHSATWTVFDHPIFEASGRLCSETEIARKWPLIPYCLLGFFWNQCAVLCESGTKYVNEQYRYMGMSTPQCEILLNMKFSSVVHAKHVNDFLICLKNKLQIQKMSQNLQFFSFKTYYA